MTSRLSSPSPSCSSASPSYLFVCHYNRIVVAAAVAVAVFATIRCLPVFDVPWQSLTSTFGTMARIFIISIFLPFFHPPFFNYFDTKPPSVTLFVSISFFFDQFIPSPPACAFGCVSSSLRCPPASYYSLSFVITPFPHLLHP